MTDIEKLLAIEEIKQVRARYFRCVDTKDWDGYAALFADDVHFDVSTDDRPCVLHSPQAIIEMASAGLKDCVSVHHGHCPEITLISDNAAAGVWAMEDMLCWNEGAASPNRTLHGYGHYVETYSKTNGSWGIQTMKLTRLRVDTTGWETAL
jgi:hypothetical protein